MTLVVSVAVLTAALYGLPALALAALAPLLRRRTVRNYRGRDVYLGLGWAWVAWAAGLWGVRWYETRFAVPPVWSDAVWSVSTSLVVGVFLLGWLDDTFGTADFRGFKGHLTALRRGRVTTGLVKLLGIVALSLFTAYWRSDGPVRWLLAAVVIAGTANFVNLTDLRPGRALKAYALLALVGSLAYLARNLADRSGALALGSAGAVFAVLLAPVLALWPYDLGERGMLGDAGANAAGAAAGYLIAVSLPLPGLVVAALAVVALNLASERVSFSKVIEADPVLRRLDGLGRLTE